PKSTPDWVFLIDRSKPASFHWLWRSCSTCSRPWLPAVVLISRDAGWPFFSQIPALFFVQPSSFIKLFTLARLWSYFAKGVLVKSSNVGTLKLWSTSPLRIAGKSRLSTIALRSVAYASAWRTFALSSGGLAALSQSPSYWLPKSTVYLRFG